MGGGGDTGESSHPRVRAVFITLINMLNDSHGNNVNIDYKNNDDSANYNYYSDYD